VTAVLAQHPLSLKRCGDSFVDQTVVNTEIGDRGVGTTPVVTTDIDDSGVNQTVVYYRD